MDVAEPKFSQEMLEERGYCLFISHNSDICGLPNPGVLFFEDETHALDAAVALLVRAGIYRSLLPSDSPHGWGWQCVKWGERFATREEALGFFQDCLGASEYFHVYPLHELKQVVI